MIRPKVGARHSGVVMVTVCVLALAGCGGGHRRAVEGQAGTGVANAATFARSVNLRGEDLPSAIAEGEEAKAAPSAFASELARCGGALPGWEAGSVHSAKFGSISTGEVVVSAVHAMPSAAVARRRLEANSTVRVRACVGRVFHALGPSGPLDEKSISVFPLGIHSAGMAIVGIRVAIVLKRLPNSAGRGTLTTHIDEDILGFVVGSNEVALTDADAGRPDATREKKLLLGLYSRASHAVA
jgi:hypothetical protein